MLHRSIADIIDLHLSPVNNATLKVAKIELKNGAIVDETFFLLYNLYLYNKFSGLTHFCNTSWVFTNTAVFGCTPLLLDPPHLLGNAGVKLKVNI